MLRPSIYKAKVLNKTQVTWKVTKLNLAYTTPSEMEFIPGQFVNLKCPNGHYRSYSISSDPKNLNELYLLIETGHKGLGSDYVKSLQIGDEVEFIGPSGRLALQEPPSSELKFFATGTGIAPFIPMLHRLVDIGYEGKIDLFLGSRAEKEVLEQTHLKIFKTQLPNFSYRYYISQPENIAELDVDFIHGRITDELNKFENISKTATYYICGHPSMVDEVEHTLELNMIDRKNVIVEEFTHSHH